MANKFSEVQANIDGVRDELKADINALKMDINGVREDINGVRDDINGVRDEIKKFRFDVSADIREQIFALRTDLKLDNRQRRRSNPSDHTGEKTDGHGSETRKENQRLPRRNKPREWTDEEIDAHRVELRRQNKELRRIRASKYSDEAIDAHRAELKEENRRLRRIRAEDDTNEEINGIHENVTGIAQTLAKMQNQGLKTPLQSIHAVPRLDGMIFRSIEPRLFPQHAKEFYSLRMPSSLPRRRLLLYLADFYDIQVVTRGSEESDADNHLLFDAEQVVDQLEKVLGLEGLGFDNFAGRAQKCATRSRRSTKRSRRGTVALGHDKGGRCQRIPIR